MQQATDPLGHSFEEQPDGHRCTFCNRSIVDQSFWPRFCPQTLPHQARLFDDLAAERELDAEKKERRRAQFQRWRIR